MIRIHILPENISVSVPQGTSLLPVLHQLAIEILLPCAGNGSCGKCQIRFRKGAPPADTVEQVMISAEKRALGFRLACRTILTQDAEIEIPESIRLAQFSSVKTAIPETRAASSGGPQTYFIALDCGTTTLAAAAVDAQNGQTVAVKQLSNPQAVFGFDLISRIALAAESAEALQRVRQKLLDGINRLVTELCRECAPGASVTRMVCAGNAVMNHFIRNVNPLPLAQDPFEPLFTDAIKSEYNDLFAAFPKDTQIITLPNAGGFVGGDLAADLITAGFGSPKNYLLLDLGTNCEIALQYRGQVFITSAPAGPALEGASIACGMQAVPGAIDSISLTEQGLPHLHTIEEKPAIGICGNGLFHLIEFFRRYNIITLTGQLQLPPQNNHLSPDLYSWIKDRFRQNASPVRFNLTDDGTVYMTQKDIREFQLARAAIRTAWLMLCKQADCPVEELDAIFIAGAFGTFIRPEIFLYLQIIPQLPESKIRFIGNAALEGARMIVTDPVHYQTCRRLIKQSHFVEMAGTESFQELFIGQLNF